MKLANVIWNSKARVALIDGRSAHLLHDRLHDGFDTTDQILASGINYMDNLSESIYERTVPVDDLKFLPAVMNPEKIVLAAVNYRSHAEENRREMDSPYFFTRFRNTLIGPYDDLLLPATSKKVDWEAELAVIIGYKGKYIARERAMEYVAGYAAANDFSARDKQIDSFKGRGMGSHWFLGKSIDRSFPLGPYIITTDSINDPSDLGIRLFVNSEKMQDGKTSEMIFDIPALIHHASDGVTLMPGDIISTGTPSGVAYYNERPFIKDGDVIRTEIEKVGELINRAVQETI